LLGIENLITQELSNPMTVKEAKVAQSEETQRKFAKKVNHV
jgi:hypothetical protein